MIAEFSLVLLAAGFGADTSRSFAAEVPPRAKYFVLHAQGDLRVFPTAPGTAPHAELEVGATGGTPQQEQDFLAGFAIELAAGADQESLRIETRIPDPLTKPPALSFQGELRLWLPLDAALVVENRYGTVQVAGRGASLEISCHLGPVEVDDVVGDVTVLNHYDRVRVQHVRGDVRVQTNSERLELRDIQGRATAINRFGEIFVEDVSGMVDIENRMSTVEVHRLGEGGEVRAPYCSVIAADVAGSLTLLGNNGTLDCVRIGGTLRVEHRHSALRASDVRGPFRVQGEFLPVVAEDLRGEVEVQTTSSSVDLRRVLGSARVETNGGGLSLTDMGGSVSAHGEGGVASLTYTKWPPPDPVATRTIENRNGPLEIVLPESSDATLTVTSTIGSLESDFEGLIVQTQGRTRSGVLRLGTGSTRIEATCLGNAVKLRRFLPDP